MLKEYNKNDHFMVIFYRSNGQQEEHNYNSYDDAQHHMSLFVTDDSQLYSRISLLHVPSNTVLHCLFFDDAGALDGDISEKDYVRLKPSRCTPDERKYIYAVTNINDANGRIEITCMNSSMQVLPTETVSYTDIVAVGCTMDTLNEESSRRPPIN